MTIEHNFMLAQFFFQKNKEKFPKISAMKEGKRPIEYRLDL